MKLSELILLSVTSLLVAAPGAYAGKPDPDAGIPVLGTVIESDHVYPWEMQRINAGEEAENGDALKAFNFYKTSSGVRVLTRYGTISIQTSSTGEGRRPGTAWR